MYIKSLYVRNFRKIGNEGTKVTFRPDLNILVGENNSGKSSMADALQLALSAGLYKKNHYVNISDFHINDFGERANEVRIDIYFENLNDEQAVTFFQLTNGTDMTKAELHLWYTIGKDSKGNEKVREEITGGPNQQFIDKELFDSINLTFMPALRDAEKDLRPSKSSQLAQLLYSYASTQEEKDRITAALINANATIREDVSIRAVEESINSNLNLMEKEELNQQVSLTLLAPTFDSIASALDVWFSIRHKKVKVEKVDWDGLLNRCNVQQDIVQDAIIKIEDDFVYIDVSEIERNPTLEALLASIYQFVRSSNLTIRQNGLGYNNILSMATLLGNLQEKPSEGDFSIFLVEEPEAHLHPQLLDLLFSFFQKSNRDKNIQIILTSHSPTLISKAEIDNLIALYQNGDELMSSSLAECGLNSDEKSDLKRYLDVTKSQMFFAKRVIFVEGISEALLLTEFANIIGKPFDKYAVEIVNIDGLAFKPYAKLFVPNDQQSNLKYPCVIISDDDRCIENSDPHQIKNDELVFSSIDVESIKVRLNNGRKSSRAMDLLSFDSDNVEVKLAKKTLEYELALLRENRMLLLEVLETLHPDICNNIRQRETTGESDENIAIYIWIAIRDCKGSFAQGLAREIHKIYLGQREDTTFVVPDYIKDAIDFLIR